MEVAERTTWIRRTAPALAALVSLAVGEVALPRLLYKPLDPQRRYSRNPHLRRDWDNYITVTAAPRSPEVRVLLLSNSQGNGPEYPDRAIYPWVLQDRLNEGRVGQAVRVVNWSFGPNRVPEAVALLARAQELRPDLVVAIFNVAWFQEADYVVDGRPTPLRMFPGDVVDTAWLYRTRLSTEYGRHYLKPITALNAVFARYWPTYRFRDLPVSYLQVNVPWFEPFVPEGEWAAWFLAARARHSRLQAQPAVRRLPSKPHPVLIDMLADAAERLGSRRVFVLQPHYFKLEGAPEGFDVVEKTLRGRGFDVWDMSAAVPWRQFLEGQNIHLADDGHRTFATALAERIGPMLAEIPDARP